MQIDREGAGKVYLLKTDHNRGPMEHQILVLGDGWVIYQRCFEEARRFQVVEGWPIEPNNHPAVFHLDGNKKMEMVLNNIRGIKEVQPGEMKQGYFRQHDPELWSKAIELYDLALKAFHSLDNYVTPMSRAQMTQAERRAVRNLAFYLEEQFTAPTVAAPIERIARLTFIRLGIAKPEEIELIDPDRLRKAVLKRVPKLKRLAFRGTEKPANEKEWVKAAEICRFVARLRESVHEWGMSEPIPGVTTEESDTTQ